MLMKTSVIIVPIGNADPEVVEHLREKLKTRFNDCIIGKKTEISAEAYDPKRRQGESGAFLRKLSKLYSNVPARVKVLGVTEEDLYSPGLNFVFGQAELGGQYAVISLKRLDPEFYGMPSDRKIYNDRAIKEAVHEIGHTMGLLHCPDKRCVMHFSNSIYDTDIKGDSYCARCSAMLRE